MVGGPEVHRKQQAAVEIVDWTGWLPSMSEDIRQSGIKGVFKSAQWQLWQDWQDPKQFPISYSRKGKELSAVADVPLDKGTLVIITPVRQEGFQPDPQGEGTWSYQSARSGCYYQLSYDRAGKNARLGERDE